jgi:putative CocE/NonD family hydrolase
MKEKYIFVCQDVRGRYMSEGVNLEMTPHIKNKTKKQVDESSDTYDTVDWLLKNIRNNNGRVGIYGISYPGFYATASLLDAHPAIKAVSPQAPVTDEFKGDDANHNGAFFLMDNFNFINYFGANRNVPVKEYTTSVFPYFIKDAYAFFRNLGPIKNSQSAKYFNNQCNIWNEYLQHDTYDDYWKSRNISTHLQQIKIPTLVVGGWFDAENLYGSLTTYKAIESGEINNNCKIVMGPWTHGAWASSEWKQYASHDFKSNTSKTFQDSIETSFFNYHLKDKDSFNISEATIFETGSNKWTHYDQWPPQYTKNVSLYLNSNNEISATPGNSINGEEYTSDPAKPVPYTAGIYASRNNDFLAEDQRFAYTRPDVLYYQSSVLENDFTVTGPISANLQISISGTDADFIIKVIDVLPDNEPNFRNAPKGFQMAGYQRLVRAEVMRGKFRNSLENPEPFEPNKITSVNITLNDVAHTFKKGHKIMVQIQSSWFPLVDMNPQQYMKIPDADKDDFKKISVKIFHNSKISFPSLQQK